jgi:hypothetical protein
MFILKVNLFLTQALSDYNYFLFYYTYFFTRAKYFKSFYDNIYINK